MGSVRVRKETGRLYLDFWFRKQRCREQTALEDTPVNRKKLGKLLAKVEAEITLGAFEYERYFPESNIAKKMAVQLSHARSRGGKADQLFGDFANKWLTQMKIQWRASHILTVEGTLEKYLLPEFGSTPVDQISKSDILDFRSYLAGLAGRKNKSRLSAERINHILTPLRMILEEAADRYDFTSPYRGIKSLPVPRTEVEPFNLDDVMLILDRVRADYRAYYTVRFFTGMRTAEVDGLKWKYVDFERRQILIRETWVRGNVSVPKNDGSRREIDMPQRVVDALKQQKLASGEFEYVFTNRLGKPLNNQNVTKRVWHPLLRHLGMTPRRPYQTRHTAATLWLAAGESPEWIAKQMGHSTTEMLFRVYSRYVPNLTRHDGSAFERLLQQHQGTEVSGLAKDG